MHLSWRLEKLCKAEYEFMVAFPSFKDMLETFGAVAASCKKQLVYFDFIVHTKF